MPPSMIEKIPTHTIIMSREDGKNAKGEPIYKRVTPEIGKPFKFTKEEHDGIMKSSPLALRDPKNESDEFDSEIKAAGIEAAAKAVEAGGAPGDAASVAATAKMGKAKNRNPSGAANAEESDSQDDADTL